MATIVQSGLYPPIIDNYIPAIDVYDIITEGMSDTAITIYFDCSNYNNPEDIKAVHVSITRQSDYKSLLNSDRYPMGIALYAKATADDYRSGWYKISIPKSHVDTSMLEYNTYYKVQLRLDKSNEGLSYIGSQLSNYLVNEGNLTNFSEWSKVGLARFIATRVSTISLEDQMIDGKCPTNIKLVGEWRPVLQSDGIWTQEEIQAYPKLTDGTNDNEYMKSYVVRVEHNGIEVFRSKEQHPESLGSNQINYDIPFNFAYSNTYHIFIDFTSANLFNETMEYFTPIIPSNEQQWNTTILSETTTVDTVVGKTSIVFENGGNFKAGKLTIKRANHLDDFTIWDTMYVIDFNNSSALPHTYTDSTIESGTIYKYKLIYTYTDGTKKTMSLIEGDVLSIFDHAFLTGEHTQLPVKFNPNISSFRYNRADNIVTTIGSQYPYITRNANTNYRTFSLSGTIAYEMDIQKDFATREDIYGGYVDIFGTYFVNHYINDRNDKITQREFRELVMSFLYSDKPKIFRSTPEGNVLVRLTDISLTPNQQIGRMIYDFNCTATEIGECSVENYKLYDIQDFGDL